LELRWCVCTPIPGGVGVKRMGLVPHREGRRVLPVYISVL